MDKEQMGVIYALLLGVLVMLMASVANFLAANWTLAGKFGVEAAIIAFGGIILGAIVFAD